MSLQQRIKELTVAKDYIERGWAVLRLANDPHAFETETVLISIRNTITDMVTFPEDYNEGIEK